MSTTPPNNKGHVPPGKVTAFDKGQYDNLIAWIDGVDQDLNKNLNKPRPGVRLDESLGSGILPGSPDWNVAARFVTRATEFGKCGRTPPVPTHHTLMLVPDDDSSSAK